MWRVIVHACLLVIGIVRKKFYNSSKNLAERSRTNGIMEQWNCLIKHKDHKSKKMRPDEFLISHYRVIKGRQLLFIDNLTEKQKQKLKVNYFANIVYAINYTRDHTIRLGKDQVPQLKKNGEERKQRDNA